MEYQSLRMLLRTAPAAMDAEQTNSKNFARRKQHAFLQVLHEILTRRNDKSGEVDEWAKCLLELDEGDFEHLEDFPKHVLQLVAFQQYRERRLNIVNRYCEDSQPLLIFLRRPSVMRVINEEVGAESFAPTEMDWMALNMLCAHDILDTRLFNHILLLASGSRGLSGLLEMTPEAWRAEIGYVVRQKLENIVFILFKILSLDPSKHDLILTLCGKSLIHITTRLEAGMASKNGDEADTDEAALDAGFFSSSEEEEGEEEEGRKEKKQMNGAAGIQTRSVTRIDGVYDSDDDDEWPGHANAHLLMVKQLLAAEEGLPAYRSSWCSLCLSSVTLLYKRVVEEKREADVALVSNSNTNADRGRGGVSSHLTSAQGLSETMAMLNSHTWQRQLLSIDALVDLLRSKQRALATVTSSDGAPSAANQAKNDKKGALGTTSNNSIRRVTRSKAPTSAISNAKRGEKGRVKQSAAHARPVEELCRSGYLRHLTWNLVNERGSVRFEAALLFTIILDLSNTDHGDLGVDLWAALVEQGLVAVLELVRVGFPVRPVPERTAGLPDERLVRLFPEQHIRDLTSDILRTLSLKLQSVAPLRLRLASALLHSGNPTLRLNIFCAMLVLCRMWDGLGQSIWSFSTPSSQIETTSTNTKDKDEDKDKSGNMGKARSSKKIAPQAPAAPVVVVTEAKGNGEVFHSMLYALLKDPIELKATLGVVAHVLRSSLQLKYQEQQQLHEPADSQALTASSGGPTVVVDDEGSMIKMVCPAPAAVARYSAELGAALERIASQASKRPDIYASTDIASLPRLYGSYALWQDVFSHMTNEKLQDTSITRMSLDQIVDAFHLARRYKMHLLVDKYAAALAKRLRGDTIIVVMECALGLEMKDGILMSDEGAGANELPLPLPVPSLGSGSTAPQPPVSPTAVAPSTTHTASVSKKAHLGLLSACFDWMEKNIEAAFSSRRPSQATELADLVHSALEAIIV